MKWLIKLVFFIAELIVVVLISREFSWVGYAISKHTGLVFSIFGFLAGFWIVNGLNNEIKKFLIRYSSKGEKNIDNEG